MYTNTYVIPLWRLFVKKIIVLVLFLYVIMVKTNYTMICRVYDIIQFFLFIINLYFFVINKYVLYKNQRKS